MGSSSTLLFIILFFLILHWRCFKLLLVTISYWRTGCSTINLWLEPLTKCQLLIVFFYTIQAVGKIERNHRKVLLLLSSVKICIIHNDSITLYVMYLHSFLFIAFYPINYYYML